MAKKSKLLVCVDGSEHSRVAVRFACKEAERLDFKVEMIHVINPSEYNSLFMGGDMLREEKHAEAEKLLKDIVKQIKDLSTIKPSYVIREGFLSDEVVKAIAEDESVNMLILGKAPETASKNDIIALLSAQLVSKIMVPMLIVPGNLTDLQIEDLT
jgi:nucleotide-binding universal stress UspA family protein